MNSGRSRRSVSARPGWGDAEERIAHRGPLRPGQPWRPALAAPQRFLERRSRRSSGEVAAEEKACLPSLHMLCSSVDVDDAPVFRRLPPADVDASGADRSAWQEVGDGDLGTARREREGGAPRARSRADSGLAARTQDSGLHEQGRDFPRQEPVALLGGGTASSASFRRSRPARSPHPPADLPRLSRVRGDLRPERGLEASRCLVMGHLPIEQAEAEVGSGSRERAITGTRWLREAKRCSMSPQWQPTTSFLQPHTPHVVFRSTRPLAARPGKASTGGSRIQDPCP